MDVARCVSRYVWLRSTVAHIKLSDSHWTSRRYVLTRFCGERGCLECIVADLARTSVLEALCQLLKQPKLSWPNLDESNVLLCMGDGIHGVTSRELYRVDDEHGLEMIVRCDELKALRILAALEAFSEKNESEQCPADVSALPWAIFAILAQRSLSSALWTTEHSMGAEDVEDLGLLPKPWWSRWSKRLEQCDGHHDPHKHGSWPQEMLERRVEDCIRVSRRKAGISVMDANEKTTLDHMLRSVLR
ncbi:hypothetical protein DOTSEDRAFT_36557 [Dothistroma septosporum NZE10]|uniref:Protein kinase domain-containing protein n=1 Tax=Dothistroma septosporum (strain NZE10 / CBS 128990) TaxID=675120 RepID=N1PKX8_DOTSN|nr:hypothetical protein DOTSEDRAFT_36557 [Dothistroma septosporum NZE10]